MNTINLSNSSLLHIFTRLMILIAIAKGISFSLWWFLPRTGVELQINNTQNTKYYKVDFKNMLDTLSENKNEFTHKKSNSANITNVVLKGLYGKNSKGFVIVALKSSPKKTTILSIGEEFSGYVLKSISDNSVIFSQNKKEYTLNMENYDINKDLAISSSITPVTDTESKKKLSHEDTDKDIEKQIKKDSTYETN